MASKEFDQNKLTNHVKGLLSYNEKILFILAEKQRFKTRINRQGETYNFAAELLSLAQKRAMNLELNFGDYCQELLEQLEEEQRFLKLPHSNERVNPMPPTKAKDENKKISAPVIALFCLLIGETKVIEKKEYDSVEAYCEKVCNTYKLRYTDRVRQNFDASRTIRNIKKVKELILPNIDAKTSNTLIKYLESKNK